MCGGSSEAEDRGDSNERVGSESYFDQAAQTWDDDPNRLEMARVVAQAMDRAVAFRPAMEIMDYGCGTGLIARQLAPKVAAVTAVDTSAEMLAALEAKARVAGLVGIQPLLLDANDESHHAGSYDAIVSSMVLHHVANLRGLVGQFAEWCRPGGWIAAADLEPEDGSFHRSSRHVPHHGIDPAALAAELESLGFETHSIQTVYTIRRQPEGQTALRDYPVFLLTARRLRS